VEDFNFLQKCDYKLHHPFNYCKHSDTTGAEVFNFRLDKSAITNRSTHNVEYKKSAAPMPGKNGFKIFLPLRLEKKIISWN